MSSAGSAPDYDPEAVAIRPAATVMLVDDRPDLHVLMLRRSPRQAFAATCGSTRGARSRADAEEAACPTATGSTTTTASRRLGRGPAAAAGLLGGGHAGVLRGGRRAVRRPARRPGGRRGSGWPAAGRAQPGRGEPSAISSWPEGLRLQADRLHPVGALDHARSVRPAASTPASSWPPCPRAQVAAHDEGEAVHHDWVRPAEAAGGLAGRPDGDDVAHRPHADVPAAFGSAAEAVAAAAAGLPPAPGAGAPQRGGVPPHAARRRRLRGRRRRSPSSAGWPCGTPTDRRRPSAELVSAGVDHQAADEPVVERPATAIAQRPQRSITSGSRHRMPISSVAAARPMPRPAPRRVPRRSSTTRSPRASLPGRLAGQADQQRRSRPAPAGRPIRGPSASKRTDARPP